MKHAFAIFALVLCCAAAAADTVSQFNRSVIAVSGECAIDYTFEAVEPTQVIRVDILFDAAQEDATALTMTLDSARGAAFDLVYFTVTPSTAEGETDQFQAWPPVIETPLFLEAGDKLVFAYANADSDLFGIRLVLSAPNLQSATVAQDCE